MNQSTGVPEYILEESEKTHPMEKQLACLIQGLLDQQVDLAVLSGELKSLAGMSTRIGDSMLSLRRLLQEEHC